MLITFKNLKDNMKIKLPHLFKDKLKKIKKYKKCSEIKWKWKINNSFNSIKTINLCNKLIKMLN
jgi:hypothetical protein